MDIDLTVHGDDFLVVADLEQMRWIEGELMRAYEMTSEILGPEPGLRKKISILNRTIRWTEAAIEYEADGRHDDIIIEECEALSSKPMKTPGVVETSLRGEREFHEPLTEQDSSRFRAVAARINYLAMDRADLQFAAKCLCRKR